MAVCCCLPVAPGRSDIGSINRVTGRAGCAAFCGARRLYNRNHMSKLETGKLRVGILFGGRSGEHEVSLLSAASVLRAIDREKYDVVPVGITKEGRWVTAADA